MIGVFAAADVFLFYVFFEVMLVPMYFIIGSYGGARRQYAAVKFFLYSPGRRPLHAGRGDRPVGGRRQDLRLADADPGRPSRTTTPSGGCSSASSSRSRSRRRSSRSTPGCRTPVARLRRGAAALLVGVLDKVGTFGILRYCLPLFPEASRWFAPAAMVLAVIGIIYAALLAVGQNDLKRLVSYTSIAHFGFIGIGIFAFTTQAGTGAVLYMVNHGLATGLLFLVVGMFVARRGSRAGQRLRRRRQAGAGAGRGALLRRSGLAGAARHRAVRQRVPGADRHVHGEQDGRGDRHRRHRAGRRVRAVDGAAHHAGHAQPGADRGRRRCSKDISLREKVVVAPADRCCCCCSASTRSRSPT